MKQIKIFDTTLRDGEQSPGCSMNLKEKIEMAKQLERLNVDVIEAGFAASSPGDFLSVKTIAETLKNCTVASLARALPADIDRAYEAVKEAVSPRIHTFIATSPIHMEYKLLMKPEAVLESAEAMVKHAKKYVSDIEFSAEDATRSDTDFLAKIFDRVIKAGATMINIPDTVVYTTPEEYFAFLTEIREKCPALDTVDISVHCHNDLGLAVANSLAAVKAGATQLECTINGIGERAGNASLEEIAMAMKTRKDLYQADTRIVTQEIMRSSKMLSRITGVKVQPNNAIVGENAFAHEAGIHQDGVLKNKQTYEIMTPESIGIRADNIVLGKHSGKHAFESHLKEMGYTLSQEELLRCFQEFKVLCDKKKTVNDADIEALVTHNTKKSAVAEGGYALDWFAVHTSNFTTATTTISLKKGDERFEEVCLGDGPIDASFNAIDKIVKPIPHSFELYTINSISEGKDTLGSVTVKLSAGNETFTGRGLSTDIIEASILAYIEAANKLQQSTLATTQAEKKKEA